MNRLTSVRLDLFEALVNACDRAVVRRKPEADHLVTGRRGEPSAFFICGARDSSSLHADRARGLFAVILI